mmetsp:Transcript_38186/g.119173  ORF Transcript_38186/g.119173 Transcript_38186/m.119173 type:complete len:305 (+) Transcript_38186:360-1274(+)
MVKGVTHENVVEDGAFVHRPQLKPNPADVVILVHLLHVVEVLQLLGFPLALVLGVVDGCRNPCTLVLGVVDHGGLPNAVLILVPLRRLLGSGVADALLVHPIARLCLGGVVYPLGIDPGVGPLVGRVVVGLVGEVPVVVQAAGGLLLQIHVHNVCVVRFQHQCVEMREVVLVVIVQTDVRVPQKVLALPSEDQVNPCHVVAADVGAEHDLVWRGPSELRLIKVAAQELDVAPTTEAELLGLVLHGELQDEILPEVGKRLLELCGNAVVVHVLRCPQTLLLILVGKPVARAPLEPSRRAVASFPS